MRTVVCIVSLRAAHSLEESSILVVGDLSIPPSFDCAQDRNDDHSFVSQLVKRYLSRGTRTSRARPAQPRSHAHSENTAWNRRRTSRPREQRLVPDRWSPSCRSRHRQARVVPNRRRRTMATLNSGSTKYIGHLGKLRDTTPSTFPLRPFPSPPGCRLGTATLAAWSLLHGKSR